MIMSLSTSWISGSLFDARPLIQALQDWDLKAVELEYRLSAKAYDQLKSALKENRIQVSSMHNYCPFPGILPGQGPSGDYFRLSSPDRRERRLAVDWTRKTIEQANDMEAPVVVLHCGAVEIPVDYDLIRKLLAAGEDRSDELQQLIDAGMQDRLRKRGPFLDGLLFSLDQLLRWAEKYSVTLGIENRFHFHELPGHEELTIILNEFAGGPIGYWHDTGHAHAQEKLGIVLQKTLLDSFGQKLVGIHLHDAVGLRDHLPPGDGEIDFNILGPYVDLTIPLVLELAPATSPDQLSRAVDFMKNRLHFFP